MPARSRKFIQDETALKKRKQSLWQDICHLAPYPDKPYSDESSFFFYQKCMEKDILLDEVELEDYHRIVKKKERVIPRAKELALGAD